MALPVTPAGAATTSIPVTARVSSATGGGSAGGAYGNPYLDATGRYAFFNTPAALVAADTNAAIDVYRKDRLSGRTERVSLMGETGQISQGGRVCAVTADGRFVVFHVSGPGGATAINRQLWRRDLKDEATVLISQSGGAVADAGTDGGPCGISDDGNRVTFSSDSTNLGAAAGHVYVRQIDSNSTTVVSRSTGGTLANDTSFQAAISADGGVVAFMSEGSNLVAGDTNATRDIFVRVLATNTTQRVSTDGTGGQGDGDSQSPDLSSNGRYVVFGSTSSNLVPDDDNIVRDIFRKDRQTGAVVRASVSNAGAEATATSTSASVTPDGRYVAFLSDAPNLYPADANGKTDAFRRDLTAERTDLVSRRWNSIAPGNAQALDTPAMSSDGRAVAFTGQATDLVPDDTNDAWDTFVRDFAVDIAPFGSAKAFVTQQLVDFAPPGIFPTQGTIDGQAALLQHGAWSPDGFIVSKARGTSWTAKRSPLIRLYWAFFLRAPDLNGMTYWTNQLTNGKTLAKVAAQFAQSSEFQTKYGSKTDEQFVTLIYQNIFEREPDPGGLAYWTGKLATKTKTRGDVMVNFSESSEGKRFLAPQVDTVNLWIAMLGAMPPKAELTAWIADIRSGAKVAEQVAGKIRTLPAYAARVTA